MEENNAELIETIKATISNFLIQQLNEDVKSITVVLLPDMITVFCKGCFTPAELQLTKDKTQFHLLKQFKEQMLEQAFPSLIKSLEKELDTQILRIDSTVGIEGTRFLQITLSKNYKKRVNELQSSRNNG